MPPKFWEMADGISWLPSQAQHNQAAVVQFHISKSSFLEKNSMTKMPATPCEVPSLRFALKSMHELPVLEWEWKHNPRQEPPLP